MTQLYSKRSINIENPQTQPKKASTTYLVGEWIQFELGGNADVIPLVGNTTLGTQNTSTQGFVEGLCIQPWLSSDTSTSPVSYDGIVDTTDRFTMPVVPTNILTFTGGSGTFTAGETITGGTSGATAKISTISGSTLVINTIIGTFLVGETITGGSSAATGVVATNVVNALPNAVIYNGSKHNVGPDHISLDGSVAGTQFQVTKIMNNTEVEVRVIKDNN